MSGRSIAHKSLLLWSCVFALAPAAALAQAGTQTDELVNRYLASTPADRATLGRALRGLGRQAGEALLDRLLGSDAGPAGRASGDQLDLLFELLPASASRRATGLLPRLRGAGRAQLLAWLARRDLAGFRDFEADRARGLLAFLDLGAPIAVEAAKKLSRFDMTLVAADLARRIGERSRPVPVESRPLFVAMAESFSQLRASATLTEKLFAGVDESELWLAVPLLPAFGQRPDLVVDGRLDGWLRYRNPSLRQPFATVIAQVDAELSGRLEHTARARLFQRLREKEPDNVAWPLAEAHVWLFDLGDPNGAQPALRALDKQRPDDGWVVEAACLRAVAASLERRDPKPALDVAWREAERIWRADPRDFAATSPAADFDLFSMWRKQIPPRLGDYDLALRARNVRRRGDAVARRKRSAGRSRLMVALLAAVTLHLHGSREAELWLSRAASAFEDLGEFWDEQLLGPNRELDIAMALRSGPSEFLSQALTGNEIVAERVGPEEWDSRLARAEKGFRFLVAGLARELPEHVMGETPRPDVGTQEHAWAAITGDLARFYERIGEEDKAIALLDSLIDRLSGAGLLENRQAWADHLFTRASIAMDRRDAPKAKSCLEQYLRYFQDRYRDVVQSPERYNDPEAARTYYAARLAGGYVSMAVLHNVVLGDIDRAREYCRKAYALEDSKFNRVLYACYLARDKRPQEALELLATVDPEPSLYYNMACTYALSGRKQQALHYLALDLKVNHPARKDRNRQREWALKDHDLESLRDEREFQALVRPRGAGDGR